MNLMRSAIFFIDLVCTFVDDIDVEMFKSLILLTKIWEGRSAEIAVDAMKLHSGEYMLLNAEQNSKTSYFHKSKQKCILESIMCATYKGSLLGGFRRSR